VARRGYKENRWDNSFSVHQLQNAYLIFSRRAEMERRALMRLKLYACLVAVGALVSATSAVAAPLFTPFLSVDINGYNAGGGQSKGPTQAGYQELEGAQGLFLDPAIDWGNSGTAGLTKTFSTSRGNVTANLRGVSTQELGARNRGGDGTAYPSQGVYQDFVFAQRNFTSGDNFGRNFVRLQLSGLVPNQVYEVTMQAREQAFNQPERTGDAAIASYQAWTDMARLGGLDGPAAWLDANVGAGASYPGITQDPDPGTYKNPIPTLARSPVSGPDNTDPYHYAASIFSRADASGRVVVYGWSDPNGLAPEVQGASLLNGFQIGVAPEPTSLVLFGLGLVCMADLRRRDP
jgi:hypothetical protein